MKSHTIEWSKIEAFDGKRTLEPASRLSEILTLGSRIFVASVPALALVVAAAWLLTTPAWVVYLQATLWASGFVVLGLALDGRAPVSILQLATGIALPVLALLSANVAIEFAVLGTALVAAWLAAALLNR